MTNTKTPTLMAPSFMGRWDEYGPHEEWILACCRILHEVGDRIGDMEHFWNEEAPTTIARYHREFTDVIDALDYFKGSVSAFLAEDYEPPLLYKYDAEDGVDSLISQMVQYLKSLVEKVEEYYEMGFFEKFPNLSIANKEFVRLVYAPDKLDDDLVAFSLMVVCYFYHNNDLELPKVFPTGENSVYQLGPQVVTQSVLGYLFKYFYVSEVVEFDDLIEKVDKNGNCTHPAKRFTYLGHSLICDECLTEVSHASMYDDDDEFYFNAAAYGRMF